MANPAHSLVSLSSGSGDLCVIAEVRAAGTPQSSVGPPGSKRGRELREQAGRQWENGNNRRGRAAGGGKQLGFKRLGSKGGGAGGLNEEGEEEEEEEDLDDGDEGVGLNKRRRMEGQEEWRGGQRVGEALAEGRGSEDDEEEDDEMLGNGGGAKGGRGRARSHGGEDADDGDKQFGGEQGSGYG